MIAQPVDLELKLACSKRPGVGMLVGNTVIEQDHHRGLMLFAIAATYPHSPGPGPVIVRPQSQLVHIRRDRPDRWCAYWNHGGGAEAGKVAGAILGIDTIVRVSAG